MSIRKDAQKNIVTRSCVAALLLCAAWFCPPLQAQTPPEVPAAAPLYKDFVDEAGRTVRVPQPVQRIVSLAPSLTETIYALGLQDRLVGDTDYCDYPPDAQKKTKVGGAINPSLEQIVALRPDLVLVTKSLNLIETVHALDNLGVSSYGTDPHTVQQIISSTQRLADVLGVPDAGASLGADLERHLADLRQRLNGFATAPCSLHRLVRSADLRGQRHFYRRCVAASGRHLHRGLCTRLASHESRGSCPPATRFSRFCRFAFRKWTE